MSAPDASRDNVRVRLDAIAEAHRLLDHPQIPKVVERGQAGEVEFLSLDSSAVIDIEAVLLMFEDEGGIPDEVFSAFQLDVTVPIAYAHSVRFPTSGAPICLAVVSWRNFVVTPTGDLQVVGFGDRWTGGRRTMRASTGTFVASEVVNGEPATVASDLNGLFQLVQSVHDTMEPPANLSRIFRGKPQPEDAKLAAFLVEATQRLGGPIELRPNSVPEMMEMAKRLWEMVGTVPDATGLRAALVDVVGRQLSGDATLEQPLDNQPARIVWQHGRYQSKGKLGAGGMGTVYLAWDRELEQPVAIKTLDRRVTPSARSRFMREVRLMRTLRHPHLVAGYDVISDSGGLAAVMEYIEGASLKEHLAGAVEPERVVRWIADIAAGLAELHKRQIVHRDVKPANVIINEERGPVLVDLGVAFEPGSDLTRTGSVVGTPMYMSPEQLTGGEVGPSADVYALCIVLVEALLGAHPFPATTVMEAIGMRIDAGEMFAARVPQSLRDVVGRGLSADPEARPTAAALRDALGA